MKKYLAIVMAIAMMMLPGCTGAGAKNAESVAESSTTSSVATLPEEQDVLEDCTLSDAQMEQVVKDYFVTFESAMRNAGEDITLDVQTGKDMVAVYVGDSKEPALSWDDARAAYRFLYEHGQVDLEGNILIDDSTVLDDAIVDEGA